MIAQETSSTALEIVFDGDSVRNGSMDIRELAPALIALSEAYTRANGILNGERANASVRMTADVQGGSFHVNLLFGVDLVQLTDLFRGFDLRESHQLLELFGLATAGSLGLIRLIRALKGKQPKQTKKLPNNHVEIETEEGQIIQINGDVHNLYTDSQIRAGIGQIVQPLLRPGIEELTFRESGQTVERITKEDAQLLRENDLELKPGNGEMQGERDVLLQIAGLWFREGNKWSFWDGNSTLHAEIEDSEFLRGIHNRSVTFADGDVILARVAWRTYTGRNGLVTENKIVKVLEYRPAPRQLSLPASRSAGPSTSGKRKRKAKGAGA